MGSCGHGHLRLTPGPEGMAKPALALATTRHADSVSLHISPGAGLLQQLPRQPL